MELTFKYGPNETPNKNGRVYAEGAFDKAIKAYEEKIKNGSAYGELDQPESGIVSLMNVSHVIEWIHPLHKKMPRKKKKAMKKAGTWDAWKNNNDIQVKIRLLDIPSGKIARDMIEAMGTNHIGIGMRGSGTINSEGTIENPIIHTWDIINKENESDIQSSTKS